MNSEDCGYLYDAAWNLNVRTNNGVTTTFAVDGKNQLSSVGGSSCSYDNNGNLTFSAPDSITYTYDDENQLSSAQTASWWRTEWVYDGRGRVRVRKEYTWNSGYILTNEVHYVYDGMLVIQERDSNNTPAVSYTRGCDLSGRMEGAGGIGGLLARSHGYSSGSWTTHNYYHADGGGNVAYMVNSSQSMVASYRYDPFGNTMSSSGTLASANLYRFSTKEIHPNSGMYYYGYRFYRPNDQRWLNRDPLAEPGFDIVRGVGRTTKLFTKSAELVEGPNSYAFVRNDPLSWIDLFGLACNKELLDEAYRNIEYWTRVMRDFPPGSPMWQAAKAALERSLQEYGRMTAIAGGMAGLGAQASFIGGSGAWGVLSGGSYGLGAATAGWGAVGVVAVGGAAAGYGIGSINVNGQSIHGWIGDGLYAICPGCF